MNNSQCMDKVIRNITDWYLLNDNLKYVLNGVNILINLDRDNNEHPNFEPALKFINEFLLSIFNITEYESDCYTYKDIIIEMVSNVLWYDIKSYNFEIVIQVINLLNEFSNDTNDIPNAIELLEYINVFIDTIHRGL